MPKNKEKSSNAKVTKSPTKKQRSLPEESEWAVVVAPGSGAGGSGGEKGGERGRRTGKQRSLDLNMTTADYPPSTGGRGGHRDPPASTPQNKQQRGAPAVRVGGGGGNGPADPSTPTSRRPRRQRPRVDSGGNTDPPSPAVSPPGGKLLVHRHYDSAHSQERDSTTSTTTTTTTSTTTDQHKHHHHTSVSTSLQHYSHPQSLFFFHCRNLANHLYSKVYETQEDLCRKRNEIRLANLQLAAVRAQVSTLLYAIDLLVLFHGAEYRCVTATFACRNMNFSTFQRF